MDERVWIGRAPVRARPGAGGLFGNVSLYGLLGRAYLCVEGIFFLILCKSFLSLKIPISLPKNLE